MTDITFDDLIPATPPQPAVVGDAPLPAANNNRYNGLGLPETASPGAIAQGSDGKTYQYVEMTGMQGAPASGWGWTERGDSPGAETHTEISFDDLIPSATVDDAKQARDEYYNSGIYAGEYNPLGAIAKTIDAFSSGAQRAPLMGWDDEAVAAARSFAGTDYEQAQQEESAKKQAMREQNPVASTLGEVAGGVATGGTIAGTGATVASRSLPVIGRTGAAALEGGAYGAVTGAGEADPGERLNGATWGAGIGAISGGTLSKLGDLIASKAARAAVQKDAPTAQELSDASTALYDSARKAGISIKPATFDRVAESMATVAGRINQNLRPKTAGIVEDVMAMKGQPIDLQQFDELRQTIGLAMKNADDQDVRTLTRMRNVLDRFADNAQPADVAGDVAGFEMMKDARALWAKKAKTDQLNDIFDLADVNSEKYSQSGMANAIRLKSEQLYNRIVKGQEKGFTREETALIRQMAKGELNNRGVKWLAKLAPRSTVPIIANIMAGGAIGSVGGPVGATLSVVPAAAGFAAARSMDNAAVRGMNALRAAAATGNAPVLGAVSQKTVPLIGGTASEASSQLTRSRR